MELLDFVCAKFHEEPGIFKLLVVDSIMALFRVDFSGRGELADRQQSLAQMSKLKKISEEYNVAVLVTNQMTSNLGATMSFQADPKKPKGGNIITHASTTRISLRKCDMGRQSDDSDSDAEYRKRVNKKKSRRSSCSKSRDRRSRSRTRRSRSRSRDRRTSVTMGVGMAQPGVEPGPLKYRASVLPLHYCTRQGHT